jgi:protein gp37
MSASSNIEWTDATWNPIVGCSIVSPGCTNCYAMKLAGRRLRNTPKYRGLTKDSKAGPVWIGEVRLWEKALTDPLHWREPRKIFVNSEGDLFHESIPDEWIDGVFAVMALCPQHTFQVLTKRAERMRGYMTYGGPTLKMLAQVPQVGRDVMTANTDWPLPNVWLGISAERQEEADERIPFLLQTPAAVRFISAEPLLAPVDLSAMPFSSGDPRHRWDALTGQALMYGTGVNGNPDITVRMEKPTFQKLDWVIVGGESGRNARPMQIEWADSLVAQCKAVGVSCFVKQLGASPLSDGYHLELRDRKGGDQTEWPESLCVREFPGARS